jgi:hypothetical protein
MDRDGQTRLRWEELQERQIVVDRYYAEGAREEKWYTSYYVITKMNEKSAWLDRCTKDGVRGFLSGLGERVAKKEVPRWVLTSSIRH